MLEPDSPMLSRASGHPYDLTSFSTDIENSDLYTSQERSLEENVTQHNDVLGDLLEKDAPLKTIWLIIRPAAPWVNDDILSARK